jgi:hypothetical protein
MLSMIAVRNTNPHISIKHHVVYMSRENRIREKVGRGECVDVGRGKRGCGKAINICLYTNLCSSLSCRADDKKLSVKGALSLFGHD